MAWCRLFLATALTIAATAARGETVVASLSDNLVEIQSNFVGTELVLFGLIEPDSRTVGRRAGYDVVVVVRGPDAETTTWRRERIAGVWVNAESVTYPRAPSYYAALATRPVDALSSSPVLMRNEIGLSQLRLDPEGSALPPDPEVFRLATIRRKQAQGLYFENPAAVEMMTERLFATRIPLPANIRTGGYRAHVHVFADGALLATERLGFWVRKTGFEAAVFNAAQDRPLLYGLGAVALAVASGWLAGIVFRRD